MSKKKNKQTPEQHRAALMEINREVLLVRTELAEIEIKYSKKIRNLRNRAYRLWQKTDSKSNGG